MAILQGSRVVVIVVVDLDVSSSVARKEVQ